MNNVLPFRSSKRLTSSCAMSTCGSFWNTEATVTVGTPVWRASSMAVSALIMQSAWPAAMTCRPLSCGPPILMVTSRPCFLYVPSATA